ncbi:hypothetical protein BGX27_004325 [Mortierella sp. AM989]|nr:hypothetical protein BGX27_004325 [Mortierella sp. AM989]
MDVSQAGEERVQDNNNTCQANTTSSPSTISPSSPIPLPQPAALMIPTATGAPTPTVATATLATATTTTTNIPKLQKRRSFAQSLKNSMISLTQLLSPTSSQSSRASSPTTSTSPPHYNILVLGSDSAPLASTIYKMSSLLPRSTKIRHYQEISGFFVAYFRSNDSFSCSPKIPTDGKPQGHQHNQAGKDIDDAKAMKEDTEALTITREDMDEVKSRRSSIRGLDDEEGVWAMSRSSEETLLQLKPSSMQSSMAESSYSNCNSDNSTVNSVKDMEREEVLLSDTEEPPEDANMDICEESGPVTSSETEENATVPSQQSTQPEQLNPSAKASLSVHAFSLDTTWPVPRILAQTFWFPFAHGIIYIVDATRKNDPRGVDHLLNARQFLASLVADPHFMRRDIPVVVFANKAGSDHETCYRLDEIAEILGCEDWDINVQGGNGSGGAEIIDGKTGKMRTRPWCVKSTRTDGAGDGIRASVEWLKSRMGEIWNP